MCLHDDPIRWAGEVPQTFFQRISIEEIAQPLARIEPLNEMTGNIVLPCRCRAVHAATNHYHTSPLSKKCNHVEVSGAIERGLPMTEGRTISVCADSLEPTVESHRSIVIQGGDPSLEPASNLARLCQGSPNPLCHRNQVWRPAGGRSNGHAIA